MAPETMWWKKFLWFGNIPTSAIFPWASGKILTINTIFCTYRISDICVVITVQMEYLKRKIGKGSKLIIQKQKYRKYNKSWIFYVKQ